MFIEKLDYGVTIDSKETVNYFRNFPDRGSIGYFSFEDAEADRNSLGNVEKYLDIVEDFISAGLIGDHYVFINGQVSEIISEYEGWDWTPETGIVPWKSEIDPEPEVCLNRKQRRAARRVQNVRHKRADRLHGKRRLDSAKNLRRWENNQAQMERPQVLWCQNHKGEYVPSKIIDRKYYEKRLNESAQSQFDHTPFDEDVWDFVAELPDPLEEEKAEDYWNSPSDFLTTTSVFQEDAWMYLNRGGTTSL